MKISIIVAVSKNGTIGQKGKIPWHFPEDLKRFKKITTGHHLIMGRKTYESIGHPLPGRTNIVITRDPKLKIKKCIIVHSLKEALRIAQNAGEKEAMVIGGESVYKLALPIADKIYLTKIHHNFCGDTFFPKIDANEWREVRSEQHPKDNRNKYFYTFSILETKYGKGK
jgi:dihydrofolate reductase